MTTEANPMQGMIDAGNMANTIARENEIDRLKSALMEAIKNKEDAENGAWTAQEVYRRAITESLPSGMAELVHETMLRNASNRPLFSPNPAADRLRAERDRLRAALEQVFQHAFDADTPNEAIREDFDAMREIARAALNQNKVSS